MSSMRVRPGSAFGWLMVVAALGLVIGAGYYIPSLVFTLVVIGTLLAFRKFEEKDLVDSITRPFV